MFIVSNRNIVLPGPGGQRFSMPKGFVGPVPDWAEKSAYLKALAQDGKVIISDHSRGGDRESAGKRRGRGKPEQPQEQHEAEPPEQPQESVQDAPGGDPAEGG